MSRRRSILVVDDEPEVRELVRVHLQHEGFEVSEAASGEEALEAIGHGLPSLVILDLLLPGIGGLEVCRRIRSDAAARGLPLVMLTARAAEVDRVLGLEVGADDYVTKPFSPRELVGRVRAVLRRTTTDDLVDMPNTFALGRLEVDFDTHEVRLDGHTVQASPREFELLRFFVNHPNHVYAREQLLELVWGHDIHVDRRTVDAHIRRLRRRIERNEAAPELILTVRGVGYKFNLAALER